MYCCVKWLSTDVSEVRTASIIREDEGSTHLRNVGRQSFYTEVHPRRQFWTRYVLFTVSVSELKIMFTTHTAWKLYTFRYRNLIKDAARVLKIYTPLDRTTIGHDQLRGARTLGFTTAFTTAHHRSLSWASRIQFTSPANLPDQFRSHSPIYAMAFGVVLSFGLSHQKALHFSLLPHPSHMPPPPHSPWLDLPNDIWGWI
jgi:hypothetical protein